MQEDIEVAFTCEDDGTLRWSYVIFRGCEVFVSNRKFDCIDAALEDSLVWIETSFQRLTRCSW